MIWRPTGWVIGLALLAIVGWFDYSADFWWTAAVTLYVMVADTVAARRPSLGGPRRRLFLALVAAVAVVAEVLTFVLAGHRAAWQETFALCACYLLVAHAGSTSGDRAPSAR